MTQFSVESSELPANQEAIRRKCFHPSGTFEAFTVADVETSVCARFDKVVSQGPRNWAIITDSESVTYAELKDRADSVARSILERVGSGSWPTVLCWEGGR